MAALNISNSMRVEFAEEGHVFGEHAASENAGAIVRARIRKQ
jgi:hypothetical protein